MKKKLTEKSLKSSGWKSSGSIALNKVKARNAALILEKEKKDAKFTARLSLSDFEALKLAAEKKGIGYQTLLGMIIHQYISGTLVDVEEVKKLLKAS